MDRGRGTGPTHAGATGDETAEAEQRRAWNRIGSWPRGQRGLWVRGLAAPLQNRWPRRGFTLPRHTGHLARLLLATIVTAGLILPPSLGPTPSVASAQTAPAATPTTTPASSSSPAATASATSPAGTATPTASAASPTATPG